MTPSRPGPDLPAESIGALLVRVRTDAGRSQLRVAELLCAASGVPTITRHEVSRWEREVRIPSGYWLRWLAAVLDVPLDDLERAAAAARVHRDPAASEPGQALAVLRGRIDAWRRTDDLVGGADLSPAVEGDLRGALVRLRSAPNESARRALLPLVAELAQVAGWVAADAGRPAVAQRAHRLGLHAAGAAGDRPLAGYLLGTLAHLTGPPDRAVRLAGAGYARARPGASATTRSLLLHRVAFAAARAGDRPGCEHALTAADRQYDRREPDRDPGWVYWFDEAELAAMTGRCYAALGRPRRAEPLLRESLASGAVRPRPRALYAAWLAGVYLDTGDVEQACVYATRALLASVRLGSVRAWRRLAALHPRLRPVRAVPAVTAYADLVDLARPYLPDRGPVRFGGPPESGAHEATRCG